ncbi:MAG: 4-hydroxythreonine-4-phosphate dehydrogenase PdxA [Planctomycetaceae bacterium]
MTPPRPTQTEFSRGGAAVEALPVVGVTLGDIAGIGPEVAIRAAMDPTVRQHLAPLMIGHPEILRRTALTLGLDVPIVTLSPTQTGPSARMTARQAHQTGAIVCWPVGDDDLLSVPMGKVDSRAGRAAYDCLTTAIDAALDNQIDAITTAPLNKLALRQAGINSPGHTEILAERCGISQYAMMLHLPPGDVIRGEHGLSVCHVTLHTSIASVPQLLTSNGIAESIELIDTFLRQLGCPAPRVGVCALNPHAGESGLFGDEERQLIKPAVIKMQQRGLHVSGPFPADTLFKRSVVDNEFDGVVAMYHDQGHIAFKLIGFERAVNITLGLPIIRTSPSHGTAFEIAGQGVARPEGMINALLTATRLFTGRNSENPT